MNTKLRGISATTDQTEVAALFERRDLITAPVVDEQGYLLGRITIDDIVDVIRDEGDHTFMSQAGLSEEDDMFAPVFTSSKRRAVWLGINLLTALLASFVIGLFQITIEKVVALGQLSNKNYQSLTVKELSVSFLMEYFGHLFWPLFLAFGFPVKLWRWSLGLP